MAHIVFQPNILKSVFRQLLPREALVECVGVKTLARDRAQRLFFFLRLEVFTELRCVQTNSL